MATTACQPKTGEVQTVGPAEPAQRAATSFVHCVESEGGGCVTLDPKLGSWDAFALLHWLGAGSPTSILQALRRELEHHRDPYAVQNRFVNVTARYREPLRGAECSPESARPIAELLPRVVSHVQTRMKSLGLWRDEFEQLVNGLASEADDGLADGWLVHMTCFGDPYEIWVATAKEDERQVVVGMLTSLPAWLDGGPLVDEHVEGRIRNRSVSNTTTLGVIREGTVDTRWIPIPIEEF
ncbi:hypothetical protein [Enhygromyxa salina]|uniref:hypothetical protein n=1 Tax=Enhygromyxa salina TaxID=215803 RepID=UPI0011B27122|nr:hypothetical protein [Enhygromyxa salina]